MEDNFIEIETRLSQSLLWDLQHQAYCQFGVEAWSHRGVPSYITSNSFTTKNYAHVALGYIRDCLENGFDPDHPLYIFDLGAGTGRFAYLFLKALLRFLDSGPLAKVKLCYVMTDIAEKNIAFWQEHPYFRPYFQKGILDCAYFHHSQTEPIHLIKQNKILSQEMLVNPLIIIANYFFDTIPQDMFRVREGVLEEGRITLSVKGRKIPSGDRTVDPDMINHLSGRYSYHPIPDAKSYYPEQELNDLLDDYRNQFKNSSFLFPTGAFQVLRTFKDLSRSRLLLIAGDQGVSSEEQVRQWKEPQLALHGSFSMAVSYHAIGAYFTQSGGKALLTSLPDPAFVVMAGVLGKEKNFPETSLAFTEHLDAFEPTDYWRFVTLIEDQWKTPSFAFVLLLLKYGNWDVMCLYAFMPLIQNSIENATETQKQQLVHTIQRTWDNFFFITAGEGHFIYDLAALLVKMKRYNEAIAFFEHSMLISGVNANAYRSMASCYELLGNKKASQECLQKALELGAVP